MYILIMGNPDGDTYQLSDNVEVLKKKFEKEKEGGFNSHLIIAKVKPDVEFGFGSQGQFFADEVIQEWDEMFDDDDEDEMFDDDDDDFIDPAGGRGLHSHI
jgi:hypothetical protein